MKNSCKLCSLYAGIESEDPTDFSQQCSLSIIYACPTNTSI